MSEVLQNAYDAMTTAQRQDVFGPVRQQIPPSPVDGEILHDDIDTFYRESVAGVYYAPFNVDSRNFSHIPEETEAWFEHFGHFRVPSTALSDQGQHQHACACFGLLYALIERMERGEEIIFADEAGSWMIPGPQ